MSQAKTKKIVLNIGGMSCINCANTIEKALSKLNGVTRATVNLAAEKALVDYIGLRLYKINIHSVENKIKDKFPFVRDVYVSKGFPNSISVRIDERRPVLLITSKDNK